MVAFLLLMASLCTHAQFSPANAAAPSGSALSIPQAQLIQPEALNSLLKAASKPLMLQVGSHILFAESHIPGSEYVGPGSRPDGLQKLQDFHCALLRLLPLGTLSKHCARVCQVD
jgi:hypothetical protein